MAYNQPHTKRRPEWPNDSRRRTSLTLEVSHAHTGYSAGPVGEGNRPGSRLLIAPAPFESAYLGYSVSERHNGRGYATEAVRQVLAVAFEELGLHRVQAAVMPINLASIRVLEKAGFREEGLALRYLQINGVWEDHKLFALTAEEWRR